MSKTKIKTNIDKPIVVIASQKKICSMPFCSQVLKNDIYKRCDHCRERNNMNAKKYRISHHEDLKKYQLEYYYKKKNEKKNND